MHSQADLVPLHAYNAWVAGTKHLDTCSSAQSELLEAVYEIGLTVNTKNVGNLARRKAFQGNNRVDHQMAFPKGVPGASRGPLTRDWAAALTIRTQLTHPIQP